MNTELRLRPLWRSAVATLALAALAGSGALAAPEPARAADTVRGLQWYLDSLKIPQAHKVSKGRGVTVAVIDAGVDPNVPDLRGQVLPGKGFGADATADGRGTDDKISHGTGMAGLIAGRGGGTMRQLGIAPEAKILPISLGSRTDAAELAAGIRWAADNGADVISMSLGAPGRPGADEQAAVRYALDKNVVLVASAGNREQGDTSVLNPASIPGVIAVTGLAKNGDFFSGSVAGPEAVLAAPMEQIITPRPTSVSSNGYSVGSGTSESAAIVAGVVALVRAKHPDLDAANVVNRLIRTARDEGPSGRDEEYGFGAVDPVAALSRSVPAVTAHPLLSGEGAPADPSAGPAATGEEDDGPAVSISVTNKTGAVIQVALCLAVPLVVLIVVIVLVRRSRRRSAATPAGPPPGFPAPPGGASQGFPAPPGFVPPPGAPGAQQFGRAPGQPGNPYVPPQGAPAPGGYPPPPVPGGYPPPPGAAPGTTAWPPPGPAGPPPPPPGGHQQ